MLNRRQLSLYVLLALITGVFFASAATSISYPCSPLANDPGSHCVAYAKAVLHPIDLVANTQGSLTRFLLDTLVGFGIVLVLLLAIAKVQALRFRQKYGG